MRITVDIDEKQMEDISRLTGIDKKSPAIAVAVREFIRQKEREIFLRQVLAGETDYALSNEEIETASRWEDSGSDKE